MKEIKTEECKKLQLNILKYVANICEKNKIDYFLIAGTLLGAIRHDGFIPWDDDIDIGMTRENYERLKQILLKESDNNYKIIDNKNNSTYFYPFFKVVDTRTLIVEPNHKKIENYGLYVDVFPIDGLPASKIKIKMHYRKIKSMQRLIYYYAMDKINEKNFLKRTFKLILKKYTEFVGIKTILEKYDVLCKKYIIKQGGLSISNWPIYSFDSEVKPSNLYLKTCKHKFENDYYNILSDYDQYLTKTYGDYMTPPPVEKRRIHGIVARWK